MLQMYLLIYIVRSPGACGAGGPHYIDLHGREWHHGRECWVVKYVLELVRSREIGALGGEVCVGTRS